MKPVTLAGLARKISMAAVREAHAEEVSCAARVRLQQAQCDYMLVAAPAVVEMLAALEWKVHQCDRYYVCARILADTQLARYLSPVLGTGSFRIAPHVDVRMYDQVSAIELHVPREFAILRKWWAPPACIPWAAIRRLMSGGAMDTPEGVLKVRRLLAAAKAKPAAAR